MTIPYTRKTPKQLWKKGIFVVSQGSLNKTRQIRWEELMDDRKVIQ